MNQPLVTNEAVSIAVEKYADMVRRICFLYLRNKADVEDVFQEVFLKFFLNAGSFKNEQHERAWLCRVTFNRCKDLCKSGWHRKVVSIEDMEIPYETPEQEELIKMVLKLPPKYKEVVYLHYYEGRDIPEIAQLLQEKPNTVYTQLRRARLKLKQKLEDRGYINNG